MAIKTYTEQLEEVQAAITAVLTGAQEYTIAGRTYKRADLNTLRKYEEYLRPLAEQEDSTDGGIRILRGVPWR